MIGWNGLRLPTRAQRRLEAPTRDALALSCRMAFLVVASLVAGYPLFWLLYTAFKSNPEIFANVWGLPQRLNLENFREVWGRGLFSRYYLNSLIVTACSVGAILVIGSLAGYALARARLRWKEPVYLAFLAGMMMPPHVVLIPLYVMLRRAGILDTYLALVLPYVAFGLPVAIFVFRGFFEEVPRELEEAARMDGCSTSRIFWWIVVPVSRPAFATVAIYSAITVWNEFVFALTFINNPRLRTIPVGLMDFKGLYSADIALTMTALATATIPLLLVYIAAQRHIIKGLTAGALRG